MVTLPLLHTVQFTVLEHRLYTTKVCPNKINDVINGTILMKLPAILLEFSSYLFHSPWLPDPIFYNVFFIRTKDWLAGWL